VSQANFSIPPLARPDLDASAPMKRRVLPERPVISHQGTEIGVTQTVRLLQNSVEHRLEIAGGSIGDPQHFGESSLLSLTLVTFGLRLSKSALEVGYGLLQIGRGALGRRAHLRPRSATPRSIIPGSLIAPLARQRVPLSENSPLRLTAPSDPKVRFVENRLVSGGLRERLQTALCRRRPTTRRMGEAVPYLPFCKHQAGPAQSGGNWSIFDLNTHGEAKVIRRVQ
jgi:hypothetical protein